MESEQISRLVYFGLVLAALGGWMIVEYRGRMGAALRGLLAWGLILVGVAAGYGLWTDIARQGGSAQMVAPNRVEVPRAADGHYYLTLQVNGRPLQFMVDTGASNIVMSRDDARAVGIEPEGLAFIGTANTANGTVRTARVRLDSLQLAGFDDGGIAAFVTEGEMQGSLLGLDYLRHWRIEIEGGRLILTR